ncbi:ATP-dependent nuclease [Ramlibacter sp.]|uniref:ATP-dependent nuclease n=1 Tax=Ramlibacter sp. TaxID=1917967 RepID=UPI003D138355
MRIKSVHIKNLRSFIDQRIEFGEYNRLVGANGAGKSTILCALNIFFRESVHAATDLTALQAEDFHARNVGQPIEITVEFTELSQEAQKDFADYYRQGTLVVSAVAHFDEATGAATVKQYGQRMAMPAFAPYFKAANDGASAAELRAIYVDLRDKHPELPAPSAKDANSAALQAFEAARPAQCVLIPSLDQFYGISKGSNRLAKYVQWVYVPAVKDASDEQSEGKNSALSKLLARAVRSKVNFSERIKEIADSAQKEYRQLLQDNQGALDDISAALAGRIAEWAHPEAALRVEWRQDPKKSVQVEEPLAAILAKEGDFEGQLSRFGHGLQRSFLLALLQELAASGDAGPTLLLGCEEPELYQHPPQARHLSNVLHRLSEKNAQIIITTHSPHFVSGETFEDVRVVRRVAGAKHSVVCSYAYDRFAEIFAKAKGHAPLKPAGLIAKVHQVLQPALNEMFFAQRLVLVEGLEDVAYIHSWLVITGKWDEFRRRGVHIVPANGKHALLYPLIIASGLAIPSLVIFDADADKKNEGVHRSDNTALLRVAGGDDATPFPAATVWKSNHIVWPHDMGASIESEVNGDAWHEAMDYASSQCGMAADLNKNTLHIAARLANLMEAGIRPPSLDKLCDAIVTFG